MNIPEHWAWRVRSVEPGAAAIFDFDGVLSDAAGRQHFLTGGARDWDGFFEAASGDTLLNDSARLLHVLGETLQVVLLTARPLYIRPATLSWLDRHELEWDLLIMRPDRDRTDSRLYKQGEVEQLRKLGFDPRIGFEDDIRNVEMLRNEGVPCVYIHSGYYD